MRERSADESFRQFVIDRGDSLLRTAYLLCGERALAEDLLQVALWNTFRAWPRIRDQRRLEQYVKRSLINGWLGWQRRSSSHELACLTGEVPSHPVPDHAEAVTDREHLLRALALLPVRQRAVVVLRFYEDMTERHVARLLRCSVGTVKHQAADALAALRRNQALRVGVSPLGEGDAKVTKTEADLREALQRAVSDVHLAGDLERFFPPARAHRRPRRSLLVVLPVVLALLGTGAAAALPPLLARAPDMGRLFIRATPDGVDIRTYATSGDLQAGIEGELSTDLAAGLVFARQVKVPAGAVRAEATTVFGTNGHDATAVAVRAGVTVSLVRASFAGGGSDTMRPVRGWAVLAHLGRHAGGHVAAYNRRGQLIDLVPIPRPTNPGGPPEVSNATFVRTTHQGILIIGHTVDGFLSPDIADHFFVMVGLEGLQLCRPGDEQGLAVGVSILTGASVPITALGPPITLVVVHTGTAIVRVKVVFANHVADSMTPIAGQAVLATLGTVANNAQLGTLEPATVYGFDRQGRRVASVPLTPASNGTCVPST